MSQDKQYQLHSISELSQKQGAQSFYVAKYQRNRMGRPGAMLMDVEGRMFYDGRRFDIREETSEARRAWCRLRGMRNKDLDAAVKAYKVAQDAAYHDENVEDIRKQASKLGYALVKTEMNQ